MTDFRHSFHHLEVAVTPEWAGLLSFVSCFSGARKTLIAAASKRSLDARCVVFLDHLYANAEGFLAILVNVGTLHGGASRCMYVAAHFISRILVVDEGGRPHIAFCIVPE
jgi:hypothetical protein